MISQASYHQARFIFFSHYLYFLYFVRPLSESGWRDRVIIVDLAGKGTESRDLGRRAANANRTPRRIINRVHSAFTRGGGAGVETLAIFLHLHCEIALATPNDRGAVI